jgi:hypothetical protein
MNQRISRHSQHSLPACFARQRKSWLRRLWIVHHCLSLFTLTGEWEKIVSICSNALKSTFEGDIRASISTDGAKAYLKLPTPEQASLNRSFITCLSGSGELKMHADAVMRAAA